MSLNELSHKSERFLLELRDAADQDYLLARVAYRSQLDMQFVWLAHQAIEKYLKVLLIFHERSAQGVGHNLGEALERLSTVTDVPFGFPPLVSKFIEYLDERFDRYAERPYAVSLDRLVVLDATVWSARRFCSNVRENREPHLNITLDQMTRNIAALAASEYESSPARLSLAGGYLEHVREEARSLMR